MTVADASYGPAYRETDLLTELRRLLAVLWRHKVLILLVGVLGTVAAAAFSLTLPNSYVATAQISIGQREVTVTGGSDVVPELASDPITIEGEVEVMRSRSLLADVAEAAGLRFEAAVNPALEFNDDPVDLSAMDLDIVANLQEIITVYQLGRSRVIEVRVESVRPDLSARIANALVTVYRDRQLENKTATIRSAAEFLQERLEVRRAELEESERALQAFRQRTDLDRGEGIASLTAQLQSLDGAIATARGDVAVAQVVNDQIGRAAANGQLASLPQVLNQPVIQRLREQEAAAAANLAEVSTIYGPRHPTFVNAEATLQGIRNTLAEIVAGLADNQQNDLALAQARLSELQAIRAEVQRRIEAASVADVEAASLQREVDSARAVFATLRDRLTQVEEQLRVQTPDAEIVSLATPPPEADGPDRKIVVAAGAVVSGCLALLLVLAVEQLDRTVRTAEQAADASGLPVLAILPQTGGRGTGSMAPQDLVLDRPSSRFSQSMRSAAIGLFPTPDRGRADRGEAILIAGPRNGEGKTTVALGLGRALSMDQRRIVVVDGNREAPRLAAASGCAALPGATDYLAGGAALDAVLHPDPDSPVTIVPAGTSLDGDRAVGQYAMWRLLLEELRQRFDIVLIDGPGVLESPDAKLLGRLCDDCLLTVQAGRSVRDDLGPAQREMLAARVRVTGIVFNHA